MWIDEIFFQVINVKNKKKFVSNLKWRSVLNSKTLLLNCMRNPTIWEKITANED